MGGDINGRVHPRTGYERQQAKYRYRFIFSLTFALDVGGWSTPHFGRFTPEKRPIVQKVRWAHGPMWTSAENLVRTGIRSPKLPTRSESLYRLSNPSSRWRYSFTQHRD